VRELVGAMKFDDLERLSREIERLQWALDRAKDRRDALIVDAARAGASTRAIGRAAGVSGVRVFQILAAVDAEAPKGAPQPHELSGS
jgi:hypothetical protein